MKPRYSGDLSIKFWLEINSYKGKKRDYLYTMGVILQNTEQQVLRELNEARKKQKQ